MKFSSQLFYFLVVAILILQNCVTAQGAKPMRAPNTSGASGISIVSVGFTSDHDLLTNKFEEGNTSANFAPGGTKYSTHPNEFIFRPHLNNPMTHNWDAKIILNLNLRVTEKAAKDRIDVKGIGLGDFEALDVLLPQGGGDIAVTMTAASKLPKEVKLLTESIQWTIKKAGQGKVLAEETSGEHKIFLTMATPIASENGVTLKRMKEAMRWMSGSVEAGNEECHPRTIQKLNSALLSAIGSGYYLSRNLANIGESPWMLPYASGLPSMEGATDYRPGADCVSISVFENEICKIIGMPGDINYDVFYAYYKTADEPNRPLVALTDAQKNGLYYPVRPNDKGTPLTDGLNPNWYLRLKDSSGGLNNYEAALIYTHQPKGGQPAKTYYIPGGTSFLYGDKDSVLTIFESLVWVVFEDDDGLINTPDVQVTKAVDYNYPAAARSVTPCF